MPQAKQYTVKPLVGTATDNRRYFRIGELTDPQCLHLMNRMKAGAPGLHKMLHEDPFVKVLITEFDADILIPKKER